MDFPKFQRLVEERTGFRTMENATASGEYFSDSCGDMYNFFLKVGPGAVSRTSRISRPAAVSEPRPAVWSSTRKGKTIDEAAAISTVEIEAQLDGYPEKKKDYPERALEALHVALDDYRAKVAPASVPDYGAMPRRACRGTDPAAGARRGDERKRRRKAPHQTALALRRSSFDRLRMTGRRRSSFDGLRDDRATSFVLRRAQDDRATSFVLRQAQDDMLLSGARWGTS